MNNTIFPEVTITHPPQKKSGRREKIIADYVSQKIGLHNKDFVLCSVIYDWSVSNHIALDELEKSDNIKRVISKIGPLNQKGELLNSIGKINLKDVEVAFENLIDSTRKRSEGVVYTPNYIIDYIVNECADQAGYVKKPLFLDPACGGGGFVIQAISIISKKYNLSLEEVVSECIHGIDINEDAINCAEICLDLFCIQNKIYHKRTKPVFLVADSLLTSKSDICRMFEITEDGFDIISTNPPYVKLQNIYESNRIALSNLYKGFAQGSFSLAMLFLIAGHKLLSPRGVLGYITQNNIFTSLAGEGIREYLQQKKCVSVIIDFEHAKIFNNASAYTCLIFLDNKKKDFFRYATCASPKTSLIQLKSNNFSDIEVEKLNKEKWRLTAPHHLLNLTHLEKNGTALGAIASIHVGFATLKDSVFLLDGNEIDIEPEVCVSAIKISEFSSEDQLNFNRRKILRPYKKNGQKWNLIAEKEMQQKFPKAMNYLIKNKQLLSERDKGKESLSAFYEWGRSQGMEAVGPKLLTKTFSKGPQFLLDKSDSLFCNGYSITPRKINDLFSENIEIELLQIILNSWVMDYYIRLTSFQIEGGYQCYQKNFIERFSIPEISMASKFKIMNLTGADRQFYICNVFDISPKDVLEIVSPQPVIPFNG